MGPELCCCHGEWGDGGELLKKSRSRDKFGVVQGQNAHPSEKGQQGGYSATSFCPCKRGGGTNSTASHKGWRNHNPCPEGLRHQNQQ